ncbi:MAG: hypothetical protein HYZ32_05575, partial [Hydrocarboniphaga effusa]|nr:hypothetical protein [Hydrocarboniphaga effusa]
ELADGRRVAAQAYVPDRQNRRFVARRPWSPAAYSRGAATRLAGRAP